MQMRGWFFGLIGVLGTATLISLGMWQLQRLEQKEAYLAEINARLTDSSAALPLNPSLEEHRFMQVALEGVFTGERVFVLSSLKGIGPGYRVIERFESGDRVVLVDRGFIRENRRDEPLSTGSVDLKGVLHWPDEQDRFTPEPDGDLWFARDIPSLSAALDTEPTLVVAAERSSEDAHLLPHPPDSSGIPNNHLGYAVQWFGLALVWAVMSAYALIRQRSQGS